MDEVVTSSRDAQLVRVDGVPAPAFGSGVLPALPVQRSDEARPGRAATRVAATQASDGGRPESDAALEHERATAIEALDLLEKGLGSVVAERLAERLADPAWQIVAKFWAPEHCTALETLASALDTMRAMVVSGVAAVVRVTVRLTGAPELLAVLAGEIVARAFAAHVLHPLVSRA